ncbi:MAG: glycosyltransferase [Nitrosomonadales bacterium]
MLSIWRAPRLEDKTKLSADKIEGVRRLIEELRGEPTRAIDTEGIPCQEISCVEQLCREPLVSVAMVTYNHARFIRAAIEGVVQQKTAFSFELVIGEDCSTDETRAVVLEYQRRYPQIIRVLLSDANVGAASNGLRVEMRCRGRYIAYCEGDDYWIDAKKLALQVEVLERDLDVGLVFCAGQTQATDGHRAPLDGDFWQRARDGTLFRMMLRHGCGFVPTCSVMVRADAIRRGLASNAILRLDLSLGDLTRWLEVLRDTRGCLLPRPMVVYMRHPGSATQTNSRRLLCDVAAVRYWYACQSVEAADLRQSLFRNLVVCRVHGTLAKASLGVQFRRLALAVGFGRRQGITLTVIEWSRFLADALGMIAVAQAWRRKGSWRVMRA